MKIQIIQTPRCAHCLDDMTLEQEIEVWVGKPTPAYVCSEICADMYAKLHQEARV